jgi:hypothetical protein
VLYSGGRRFEAARAAVPEVTGGYNGGQLLKVIGENFVTVPDSVWKTVGDLRFKREGEVNIFLKFNALK